MLDRDRARVSGEDVKHQLLSVDHSILKNVFQGTPITDTDTASETQHQRHRDTETQTQTQTQRHRHRHRDTQTDRQTQTANKREQKIHLPLMSENRESNHMKAKFLV